MAQKRMVDNMWMRFGGEMEWQVNAMEDCSCCLKDVCLGEASLDFIHLQAVAVSNHMYVSRN